MNITRTLVSTAILAALAGCGGGDGGSNSASGGTTDGGGSGTTQPTAEPSTGVFTDSAVANLKYQTTRADGSASLSGTTNADGEYQFNAGETVSFYIGDLLLGSTEAAEVITPLELPAPIKISQILQSFDSDGDPDVAGISIPEEIHDLLEDSDDDGVETLVDKLVASVEQVDEDFDTAFDTFFTEFANEVANVNNDLRQKIKLVKAAEAKAHLEKNEHIAEKGGVEKRLIERLEEIADEDRNPRAVLNFLKATELFPAIEGVSHKIDYTAAIQFEDDEDFDKQEINRRIEAINRLLSWKLDADKSAKLGNQAGQQEFADSLRAFVDNEPVNLPVLDGLTENQVLEFFVERNGWLEPVDTMTRVIGIGQLQAYVAGQNQSIDATNTLLEILLPNIELKEDYDYLQWIDIQQNYVDLANTRLQIRKVNEELNILDDVWDGDVEVNEVKALLDNALLLGSIVLSDRVDYVEIIRGSSTNDALDLAKAKTQVTAVTSLIDFFSDDQKKAALATDLGKAEFTALAGELGIPVPSLVGLTADQIIEMFGGNLVNFSVSKVRQHTQAYQAAQAYLAVPETHTAEQTKLILQSLLPNMELMFDTNYVSLLVVNGSYIDLVASRAAIDAMNTALAEFEKAAKADLSPADALAFLKQSSLVTGITILDRVDYTDALISTIQDNKLVTQSIVPNVRRVSELFSFSTDSTKKESLGTIEGQTAFGEALAEFRQAAPNLTGFTSAQVSELFASEIIWLNEPKTLARVKAYKELQDYLAEPEAQTIDKSITHLRALFPKNKFDFELNYLVWLTKQDHYINLMQSESSLNYANDDLIVIEKAVKGGVAVDELSNILSYTAVLDNVSTHQSVDYTAALTQGYIDGKLDLAKMKEGVVKWNTLFDYLTDLKASLGTTDGLTQFEAVLATFTITPPTLTGLTADQIVALLGKSEGYYTINATRQRMADYARVQGYLADTNQHLDRQNAQTLFNDLLPDTDVKFDANYHSMIVQDGAFIDLDETFRKVERVVKVFDRFLQPEPRLDFLWYAFQMAGVTEIDRNQNYGFEALFDGGNYNLNTIQMQVATINSLAAFARKSAIWPAQERFPDSPISQDNWNADELQQLILDAGFTIPVKKVNGQTVDHNIDLILDHENNTLDLVQTQRSLNAIGRASGVASMKVNSHPLIHNNFYHFALRNDGSIVAWRINMDRNDFEKQTPVVVEMNTTGPKATEMFSILRYGAALREDGSVILWNSLNPDGVITVPEGLDGTIPAITIVGSESAFAAVRSDGSVVMFGKDDLGDFEQYQQDLDGSQHKVVSLHATNTSFAALMDNGSVVTWGNISDADRDKLAVQVPGHGPGSREQDRHLMIDSIYTTRGAFAAIKGDGAVVTWGDVGSGADLGEKQRFLNGDVATVSIAATEGAFAALRSDGRVIAWGDVKTGGAAQFDRGDIPDNYWTDASKTEYQPWLKEDYGDVNDPDGIDWDTVFRELVYTGNNMPENPAELDEGVVSVHAHNSGFTAIKTNGASQVWGANTYFPAEVKATLSAQAVKRVFADQGIFVAEMADGSLVQWGYEHEFGLTDSYGQVYGKVLPVESLNGTVKVKNVLIDSGTIIALREDGAVIQWGIRNFEIIPNYDDKNVVNPRIPLDPTLLNGSVEAKKVIEIYKAHLIFGALHADGTVTTWGYSNDNGNSLFVQRELGSNTTGIDFSAAHDADKDGVMSDVEMKNGTSPYSRDTDGDGVDDGTEINDLTSDPLTSRRPAKTNDAVAYDDKLLRRNAESLPASWLKY